jgi:hypothetical protein
MRVARHFSFRQHQVGPLDGATRYLLYWFNKDIAMPIELFSYLRGWVLHKDSHHLAG